MKHLVHLTEYWLVCQVKFSLSWKSLPTLACAYIKKSYAAPMDVSESALYIDRNNFSECLGDRYHSKSIPIFTIVYSALGMTVACMHYLQSARVSSASEATSDPLAGSPCQSGCALCPKARVLLAEYSPPSCFSFSSELPAPQIIKLCQTCWTRTALNAWWRGGQLATQLCHLCSTRGVMATIATKESPPQGSCLTHESPVPKRGQLRTQGSSAVPVWYLGHGV